MNAIPEQEIYSHIGEDGFTKLVAHFYAQVPANPILGPMYPQQDMVGAERRLRLFLIQRFGGPTTYDTERGHPRLRMRHAPFVVNMAARDAWMEMMNNALDACAFEEAVDQTLRQFLSHTATFLINSLD